MDIKTLLTLLIGLTARVSTSSQNPYHKRTSGRGRTSGICGHPIQAISGIIYAYLNSGKIQILDLWYLQLIKQLKSAVKIFMMLTWNLLQFSSIFILNLTSRRKKWSNCWKAARTVHRSISSNINFQAIQLGCLGSKKFRQVSISRIWGCFWREYSFYFACWEFVPN